ncbi:tigger transposable element-derived protein 1-like [Macrobrachium rosenbergii]|uniref:tigger transposable element-derived protein 1-like n=1 Tax=Macrobrachium rosenbergii TaxID=79674 RepID=UPI0034D687CB
MPPKKVKSDGEKVQKITIETMKEIIEKSERCVCVTDLGTDYKIAKSTISTILKNKEAIREANVAKGMTLPNKTRSQTLEKVEKIILKWVKKKQMAGDIIIKPIICEKAWQVHQSLLKETPSISATPEEFKASRGWFDNLRRRTGIHCVLRHGDSASTDKATAERM